MTRRDALIQAGYEDGGDPWRRKAVGREVRDLIEAQDTALTKVARLTGSAAA